MLQKFLEHINYLSDELDDPNTVLEVVCLPSGVYFELFMKEYDEICELYDFIINWSEEYQCYVIRDKDVGKIQKVIGREIGNDQDIFNKYIVQKLIEMGIDNYKLTKLGVEVYGNVSIRDYKCKKLPVKFNIIHGDFEVTRCGIETLENFPTKINGDLKVTFNNIKDLVGGPRVVEEHYICRNNYLENLLGSPKYINGDFDCSYNRLKTVSNSPDYVDGNFDCSHNHIETLVSSPINVDGIFNCSHNNLTDLKGIPKDCRRIISNNNKL